MSQPHGFDEKCLELAEYFLLDDEDPLNTEENRRLLAQAIQDKIEETIEEMQKEH
jgi:hypothetical protein